MSTFTGTTRKPATLQLHGFYEDGSEETDPALLKLLIPSPAWSPSAGSPTLTPAPGVGLNCIVADKFAEDVTIDVVSGNLSASIDGAFTLEPLSSITVEPA